MNNFQMDPYAILQIEKNATPEQIGKAYRAIAKVYHPDKGGNAEMFRILTEAYQTILNNLGGNAGNRGYTSDGRGGYQREEPEIPNRANLSAHEYTRDRFNQSFRENQRGGEVDFVYGVDDTNFQPRNLADYKRERDSVREDLDNMKPLFNRGMGFNQNVFNQMFEKLKKQSGEEETSMIPYSEPRAMVSQNQIGFSNLNPHAGLVSRHDISTSDLSKNYCDLNQELNAGGGVGPGASFNHPETISRKDYRQMRDQPDVTKINSLSHKDIKKRVGGYHDSKYMIPKGGPKPPSGDLEYNFDPFYQQHGQQPIGRIEYQNQNNHQNNHQNSHHNDHQNNHQNNHHNSHNNHYNRHDKHDNRHHQQQIMPPPQQHRSPPPQQQQQQIVSYTHTGSGGGNLGKPMTPQITYYRTETTSEYVVPPQQSQHHQDHRSQHHHQQKHHQPSHQSNLNHPNYSHQPNQNNNNNRENRIDGRLNDFSHMSYGSTHQGGMMPYPSSSENDQSPKSNPIRSQFGDQESHKMKEMEAELSKMKRTVRIQDKLIRKIKKKGMM